MRPRPYGEACRRAPSYAPARPSCSTLEVLATHSSRDDAWIAVHNKVYDVTKWLEDHPGGEEVLLDLAGADATEDFEDIGHSQASKQASTAHNTSGPRTDTLKRIQVSADSQEARRGARVRRRA